MPVSTVSSLRVSASSAGNAERNMSPRRLRTQISYSCGRGSGWVPVTGSPRKSLGAPAGVCLWNDELDDGSSCRAVLTESLGARGMTGDHQFRVIFRE